MRNRNLLLLLIAIIIAVLIYFLRGCPPVEEEPTTRDPIIAPISFVFYDVATPDNKNVQNVTVSIIDPLEQVRTSGGFKLSKIELSEGIMTLGIKEGTSLSSASPYSFSILAEAPGFSDIVQTITVSADNPMHIPIYMANLNSPPPGVETMVQDFAISGSSLSEGLGLNIPVASGGGIQLNIPQGTKLLCDGIPIKGDAGYLRIAYGDPLSQAASLAFPNGPIVTNAVSRNGAVLASPRSPIFFQTLGWITIDIKTKYGEVNGFSDSMSITLPINREQINPETNEPYAVGQSVPVWSLDEQTGIWREELSSPLEFQGENEPLVARFKVTHLSTWNLDFKTNICSSVTFDVENTGCEVLLASQVSLTGSGGGTPPFIRTRLLNYPAGVHPVELLNIPDIAAGGGTLTFTVFNDNDPVTPVNPFPETVSLNGCAPSVGKITISPSVAGTSCDLFGLEVAFTSGSGGSATAVPLCQDALYYRPVSGGAWNVAGYFNSNGVAKMTHLVSGTDYRFQIPFVDGGGVTTNVEFTLENSTRVFTACGPDLTSNLSLSPVYSSTVIRKCISSGGAACPGTGGGSYDCNITGTNVTSARGLFVQISGLPSSLLPLQCTLSE
ncbi:MAG: hypothetical protein KDD02_04120 [Phaeodactylibacter sp.]|nr:hypothetical protein [Phaeodactylibacter sp.]MCB9300461.1 hypothetical protein [Lewinellaceae bacterium]